MRKCINLSTFYLFLGLIMGVFYREFTKFNDFTDVTILSAVHTHILVLGFVFFLIVLLLEKNFSLSSIKGFDKWIIVYNIGLIYLVATLTFRGVLQVTNGDFSGLSHIAGLGHLILGASLIWFATIVNKAVKNHEKSLSNN